MGGALRLEIVTPGGRTYRAESVERIVFRRREREHEQGSEVAVFPGHEPMLVRMPCTPLRYSRDGETFYLAIAGGFAEVKESRVLVVTPQFEEIGTESSEVRARASALAQQWLEEYEDFVGAMTGLETLRGPAARP
jgi:F0F1-type ATP synthase epsilon subunit